MSSKDNNKGTKSKQSATGSGKQSTPLTEKNPSQIRLTIKEFTPEMAAEVSTSTGASGRKKEKTGGEASKESKPSSLHPLHRYHPHPTINNEVHPQVPVLLCTMVSWTSLSMRIMMKMKAD